ncbi:MAG: hypothetical protein ABI895_05240, partial [Deltaproteobacteria bacterium]
VVIRVDEHEGTQRLGLRACRDVDSKPEPVVVGGSVGAAQVGSLLGCIEARGPVPGDVFGAKQPARLARLVDRDELARPWRGALMYLGLRTRGQREEHAGRADQRGEEAKGQGSSS